MKTATPIPPRLLIAASGTGGHVFPAFAIAEHLANWSIEWLGVPDRMEVSLVQDRYPLHTIQMSGIQGARFQAWIRSLTQLLGSTQQVRQILTQGQFSVVLTTGGYIAAPAILAARFKGIPVVLHESNAIPGKVTRWFGRWCDVVALGLPQAADHLPNLHTQVVGTPVRSQFWDPQSSSTMADLGIPSDVPLIAVIGGSQGARGLNQMILACAAAWLDAGAWMMHLTGETDAADVEAIAPQHPHYLRRPFWHDMAGLLQRSNFAVTRAGAATLAELAATHTPAILIPYPYAAEDHQYHNALAFAATGAGIILREGESNQPKLQQLGLDWIKQSNSLSQLGSKLEALSVRTAGIQMAELLHSLIPDSLQRLEEN